MDRTLRRAVPFVLLAALALVPAACGKDDKNPVTASQATEGGGSGSGSVDLTKKPTVDVPAGDPPTALQSSDVVVGTGAEAANGQKVSVQYVGVSFPPGSSSTRPGTGARRSASPSAPATSSGAGTRAWSACESGAGVNW